MVITYHGGEFIKASFGDTTLAFNPISKDSSLKPVRSGADVTLVSLNHEDFNGISQTSSGDNEPFVIQGPGEYEIKKTIIKGFPSVSHHGGSEGINTIYIAELEGMQLCFLGALGEKKLPQEAGEAIEDIDILFVPIGGNGVLAPDDAHELSVQLEPHIVVPIHFGAIEGKKEEALGRFLKEEGVEKPETVDKLTVKKKDVETRSGDVVVIKE